MFFILRPRAALALVGGAFGLALHAAPAQCFQVTIPTKGKAYEITLVQGTSDQLASQLQAQPWYGDWSLATEFAAAAFVGGPGSPQGGYPNEAQTQANGVVTTIPLGPYFAYQVTRLFDGGFGGQSLGSASVVTYLNAGADSDLLGGNATLDHTFVSTPGEFVLVTPPGPPLPFSLGGTLNVAYATARELTPTTSTSSVPGPLPVLGGATALGWSRRLRKRCRAAR